MERLRTIATKANQIIANQLAKELLNFNGKMKDDSFFCRINVSRNFKTGELYKKGSFIVKHYQSTRIKCNVIFAYLITDTGVCIEYDERYCTVKKGTIIEY